MTISTVADDQSEILKRIMTLYVPDGFDVDVTYSTGKFYEHGVPQPRMKFDLVPMAEDVRQADCRSLPLESSSVRSVVFDPPFIHARGKESIIGQRFADARTQHALRALYMASLVEFYRVLKSNGYLIFKCQDVVESGKQVMNHIHIHNMAVNLGFIVDDLFIQVAHSRIIGHNHHEQVHARKFHCYWWCEKGY